MCYSVFLYLELYCQSEYETEDQQKQKERMEKGWHNRCWRISGGSETARKDWVSAMDCIVHYLLARIILKWMTTYFNFFNHG